MHSQKAFIIKTARNKCLSANCTGPLFNFSLQFVTEVQQQLSVSAVCPDVQAVYYWTHKINLLTKSFIN